MSVAISVSRVSALGAKAKIICSGDNDLLVKNGFRGLEIMKPRDFRIKYL